ncbi:hypothetical protein M3226_28580 [Neobacillus cucumis]|uniref:hypothetical protein n=1 Tax=Neobacillus cucumis TaxID=1740721 RepID=UPI00203F1A09|nr:hypothetical protein [Neobacillus cucumis]MCM3729545.1 hypothetical protein [Neobacillus cucumis]
MKLKKIEDRLPNEMVELLQGKTLVMLNVYDEELGRVISSALSWVFALDDKTIRFAVDHKSRLVDLGALNAEMVFTFIGMNKVYSISGKSGIKKRITEEITIKMAIIEVEIDEIRDITFYGAEITQNPNFRKTYNEKLVKKLDEEVQKEIISA